MMRNRWLKEVEERERSMRRKLLREPLPKPFTKPSKVYMFEKCPECGSTSKRFLHTHDGWVQFCSDCGAKH